MSLYLAHFGLAVRHVRETIGSKYQRAGFELAIRHMRLAMNQPGISREQKSRAFRVFNWLRADHKKLIAERRS